MVSLRLQQRECPCPARAAADTQAGPAEGAGVTVSYGGVTFRLREDAYRLRGFAYTCLFCGRNARTTTAQSRDDAMRRHAARPDHAGAL